MSDQKEKFISIIFLSPSNEFWDNFLALQLNGDYVGLRASVFEGSICISFESNEPPEQFRAKLPSISLFKNLIDGRPYLVGGGITGMLDIARSVCYDHLQTLCRLQAESFGNRLQILISKKLPSIDLPSVNDIVEELDYNMSCRREDPPAHSFESFIGKNNVKRKGKTNVKRKRKNNR